MSSHNSTLKDVFDRVAATALALPLLPVMAGLAVVSKVKYGNVFHPCDKVGRDGEIFNMFKFKTMYDAVDDDGNTLPDEERRTRIGKFMRATSLDEIPQLFNVIAGNMSLVGPRPQCQGEIDYYKKHHPVEHNHILAVKPGITGPWQVAVIGRSEKSDEESKARLNAQYHEQKWSFGRDLIYMGKSIRSFFTGHDGELLNRDIFKMD